MPVSPRTVGFVVRAGLAAKRIYCDWMRKNLLNGNDPIGDYIRFIQKMPNLIPVVIPTRPLNILLCDDLPPVPRPEDFPGGQCECVSYGVLVEWQEVGGQRVESELLMFGPIRGSYIKPTLTSLGNPSEEFRILAKNRPDGVNCQPHDYLIRSTTKFLYARILSVRRMDGQPDSCGDRPPTSKIPVPDRIPYSIDWTDENNVSRRTNVEFKIGDIHITQNNELRLQIRMDLEANISMTFTFNGVGEIVNVKGPNFYLPGSGGGGSGTSDRIYKPPRGDSRDGPQPRDYITDRDITPPPEEDIDLPDGAEGEKEPPPEPEEPEKSKVIRGVAVTVKRIRSKGPTVIFQEDNPDIYAPSLGYVNFRVRLGDNETFWTNDFPVKNVKAFIPCPWEGGAIDVKGTPQPGVEWILSPVYALTELPTVSLNNN